MPIVYRPMQEERPVFISQGSTRRGVTKRNCILIGLSINVEYSGLDGELPDALIGRKFLADTIELPADGDRGLCEVRVRGRDETLRMGLSIDKKAYAAGSSLNVARVLDKLGSHSRLSILAPIAHDDDGHFLRRRMGELGLGVIGLETKATARTLTLRDPQCVRGCTLFCQKYGYATPLPEQLDELLEGLNPNVVALTSTKSSDLALAELLAKRADFVAFMPHKDLLVAPELRERLVSLAGRTQYLQMNEYEAAIFLGVDEFHQGLMPQLRSALPSKCTAVTLAHRGAMYQDRDKTIHTAPDTIDRIVDSSGAGDTYFAAFLYYRYLEGFALRQALEAANWIAARTVEHLGPCRGLPSKEERDARFTPEWREEWP